MILNGDGMASRLIGGWQLNSIVTLETGTPFTVTASDVRARPAAIIQSRANCIGEPLCRRNH